MTILVQKNEIVVSLSSFLREPKLSSRVLLTLTIDTTAITMNVPYILGHFYTAKVAYQSSAAWRPLLTPSL